MPEGSLLIISENQHKPIENFSNFRTSILPVRATTADRRRKNL